MILPELPNFNRRAGAGWRWPGTNSKVGEVERATSKWWRPWFGRDWLAALWRQRDGTRALVQLRNRVARIRSSPCLDPQRRAESKRRAAPTLALKTARSMADPAAHRDWGERCRQAYSWRPAARICHQPRLDSAATALPGRGDFQRYRRMLAPSQQMSFAPAELAGLDRANLQGLLGLSGTPPWDPGAAQRQALADYPYACLSRPVPCRP